MDRWFVVEHNKVMERLLPGFRFYVSPAAALVLFRDHGDAAHKFGPRDSLCSNLIAALRQSGNPMQVGNLLELAELRLFLAGAFDAFGDWGGGCIHHDWRKDWLDSAPRLPVFTGLILKRAFTDTAPYKLDPWSNMKPGEPKQVTLLFNPLWWPDDSTCVELPSPQWPTKHRDTWVLLALPDHPRERDAPDVLIGDLTWRVPSLQRSDWDILQRSYSVIRTIAGPCSGLVDSLQSKTYYPLRSVLWRWGLTQEDEVQYPKTMPTLLSVMLVFLAAWMLVSLSGLVSLLIRRRSRTNR
jgi:hypothetical protein